MTLPKRVFPVPYQVDFSVESKGKRLDSTKRKLIWKFGFVHPPAVFPHLYDSDENYIGDITNDGSIVPYPDNPQKGAECRGREHEVMLTWSLLTGKAHIYVDSNEIYRHEPVKDEIFNPFSAQFHKGFNLPNSKFNGRHRIDIRCYARTPMGANNMVVDANGGKFRQYDLTVDGLSFFSFPAMYELGTDRMWSKVSRWGLMRLESEEEEEETYRGGGTHGQNHSANSGQTGRMVDEYYLDKAKQKQGSRYGQSISKSEYKAMDPKSESEEERMMRIATEASLNDWEKDVSIRTGSSEENDSSYGNSSGHSQQGSDLHYQSNQPSSAKKSNPSRMQSIGEDSNLIDFGTADETTKAMSQISISRHTASDVSVLGDDDATTASFMLNTTWGSSNGNQNGAVQHPPMATISPLQQQQPPSPGQMMYPNQQQPSPHYQDPTFRGQYAHQPWSSVGTISSNPATPRGGGMPPSDASFAVPPPPTWDDYNNAFGGSSRSVAPSVIMGGPTTASVNPIMMTPASPASVGMTSPMSYAYNQHSQSLMPGAQYGMQQQPLGGPKMGAQSLPKPSVPCRFDPLRADPFSS